MYHRELYNNGRHACIMLSEFMELASETVQVNQYLIANDNELALVDPGGNLGYQKLFVTKQRLFPNAHLKYILSSHPGSQILSLTERWPTPNQAIVLVSRLWERYNPQRSAQIVNSTQILSVPDRGMVIQLGNSAITVIPTPFLHTAGSIQFYDTKSAILFSGDIGTAYACETLNMEPISDPHHHFAHMEPFHRRHIASNKACRLWANMVRQINPQWLAPQLGRPLNGQPALSLFLAWIENIPCGIDLMTEQHYQVPLI